MKRRVHIGEEIPDVAYNDSHDLVSRNGAVHEEAEAHQDPRQIRRREDQKSKEAQSCVGVSARPNVDESGGERVA